MQNIQTNNITCSLAQQVAYGRPIVLYFGDINYDIVDQFTVSIWVRIESFSNQQMPINIEHVAQVRVETTTQLITVQQIQGGTTHTSASTPQVKVEAVSIWFRVGISKGLNSYTLYYNLNPAFTKTSQTFSTVRTPYLTSGYVGVNQGSYTNQYMFARDFVFYQNFAASLADMNQIFYQFQKISLEKSYIAAYYKFEYCQTGKLYNIYDTYHNNRLSASYQSYANFEEDVLLQQIKAQRSIDFPGYTYTAVTNKYDKSLLITSTVEVRGIQKDVASFTIELWAKFQFNTNQRFYFVTECAVIASCTQMLFGIDTSTSYMHLTLSNVFMSQIMNNPTVDFTTWNHFAISFDEHIPQSYPSHYQYILNNQFALRTSSTSIANFQFTSSILYFAKPYNSAGTFPNVYMKELRIWAPMRTQHDVNYFRRHYMDQVYPASLVQYWKFEYDFQNLFSIKDTSLNNLGQEATTNLNSQWDTQALVLCENGTSYVSGSNNCQVNQAIEEHVRYFPDSGPRAIYISTNQDFMIEVWQYLWSDSQTWYVGEHTGCGLGQCQYYIQGGNLIYKRFLLDLFPDTLKSGVTARQWHHYFYYVKSSEVDFYFDTENMGTQGYGKEYRAYTNFGTENIQNLKYMILKNYKNTVPNPTEYPFLIFYLKLYAPYYSTDIYSDHLLYDLTQRNSPLATVNNVQATLSNIADQHQQVILCTNGQFWDGLSCRFDHLVVQSVTSTASRTQKVQLGQIVYLEDYFTLMFWFSQKVDGTSTIQSQGHPSVQLFNLDLIRNEASSASSYYQFQFCGSSAYTQYYGTRLGNGWYHLAISSVSLTLKSYVINAFGTVLVNQNNHGSHTSCKTIAVPSTSVNLLSQTLRNIALKDFVFMNDFPSISQLTHVAFTPHRYKSAALIYNRLDPDSHYGWIQDDIYSIKSQINYKTSSASFQQKYYEWTYDPMSPIVCNDTDQYIPSSMLCGQLYYREKTASQCMITTWDYSPVRDGSGSVPATTYIGIGIWIKISVKSTSVPAVMTYIQLGISSTAYIRLYGYNGSPYLSGSTIVNPSYNLNGDVFGDNGSGTAQGITARFTENKFDERCVNQYCYMFLQRGGATPQLKLFRGGQLAVTQNYAYSRMLISNSMTIGCAGAAGNLQNWQGNIQHVRLFYGSDMTTSHQMFLHQPRRLHSTGALNYLPLSVGPSSYAGSEIDLRYDTTNNYAQAKTYNTATDFNFVSNWQYLALTYKSSGDKLFLVNNQVAITATNLQNWPAGTYSIYTNSNYIYRLYIWTRARSQLEILRNLYRVINQKTYYKYLVLSYNPVWGYEFGEYSKQLNEYWTFGKQFQLQEDVEDVGSNSLPYCVKSQISNSYECQDERLFIFSSSDGYNNLDLRVYELIKSSTQIQVEFWMIMYESLAIGDIFKISFASGKSVAVKEDSVTALRVYINSVQKASTTRPSSSSYSWNHFNFQFDLLNNMNLYINGDTLAFGPISILSDSLGSPNSEYISICSGTCNYFSIKDLKVWGELYTYSADEVQSISMVIGTNSNLFAYYPFNEMKGYTLHEQAFQYTMNLQNYDHQNYNKVMRWEDIDFYEQNSNSPQPCQINHIYDSDTQSCELVQDQYQTIEFYATNDPQVLSFQTTQKFSREWSIEFYFKFQVYNDVLTPSDYVPIFEYDSACSSQGTKFSARVQETSLLRYIKATLVDGSQTTIFTSTNSISEQTWYYLTLSNNFWTNQLTNYLDLDESTVQNSNAMQKLANCQYKVAYNSAGLNTNKRIRLKELRIWNSALSRQDFGIYDRINMPKRYPEIAAIIKFKDLDFYEEIYGISNSRATFQDYVIKYDTQIRNNCPVGFRQYTANGLADCENYPGRFLRVLGLTQLTFDISSAMQTRYQDNQYDFSIQFTLASVYNIDAAYIPVGYTYTYDYFFIDNFLRIRSIDFNNYNMIFTTGTSTTNTLTVAHSRDWRHILINVIPSQQKIEVYINQVLSLTIPVSSISDVPYLQTVRFGSTTLTEQNMYLVGPTIIFPPLTQYQIQYHGVGARLNAQKYDHSFLYQRIGYSSIYDASPIQLYDTAQAATFSITATGSSYSNHHYYLYCMGEMDTDSRTGSGCLPKGVLKMKRARASASFSNAINFKWHFSTGLWVNFDTLVSSTVLDFFYLPDIIDFQLSPTKNLQVTNYKATAASTTISTSFQVSEKIWYGFAGVKTSQGFWNVYNENTLIQNITDTTSSYYGKLTSMQFGDITLAGHIVRIKNIFGVARQMKPGEIYESLHKRLSVLDYRYSMLFYYRMDEDQSNVIYDSSYYKNKFTLPTPTNGYLTWDKSWEQVLFNEETWTDDFKTSQYMDRGILFKNSQTPKLTLLPTLTTMSQEYTLEFCLYLSAINVNSVILGITQLTQVTVTGSNKISFFPNLSNQLSLTFIDFTITGKWLYMAVGNSIEKSVSYIMSDSNDNDVYISAVGYSSTLTLPVSFYIGGTTASSTFSGYLRHVKIYNSFRSIGQARATLHHEMSPYIGLDYTNLVALFPLTEPIGTKLREQISGIQTTFDSDVYEINKYPSRPVICSGDTKYSNRGYCEPNQRFLQLQDTLTFSIENTVSKCFSITQWMYLKTFSVFKIQVQDRMSLVVDYSNDKITFRNNLDTLDLLTLSSQVQSSYVNQWTYLTGKFCQEISSIHLAITYKDSTSTLVTSDKGNQKYSMSFSDSGQKSVSILLSGIANPELYLKELQIYSTYISTYWNSNYGFLAKNKHQNALAAYFKMDESAGQYLYNYAQASVNKASQFIYGGSSEFKWVFEVSISGSTTIADTTFYCVDTHTELVDKHCEVWNGCDSSCFFDNECYGPLAANCLEPPTDSYYFDSIQENYYLDCYQLCKECNTNWQNDCSSCLTDVIFYEDQCLLECPINTYEGIKSGTTVKTCFTCDNPDCVCDVDDLSECYRCIDGSSKLYILSPEHDCITICSNGTYYNVESYTCDICSELCTICDGPSNGQCQACIETYILIDGVCLQPSCPFSQFFNYTTLLCEDCHESCNGCTGSTSQDCVDCQDEFQKSNSQCTACELITGLKSPMKNGRCDEICGDGKNLGVYECDDGNLISGDGCNENCEKEDGFNCGTSGCLKIDKPRPYVKSLSKNNDITIGFDQAISVAEGDLSSSDLEIVIYKPDGSKVKFSWTASISSDYSRTNSFKISLTPKESLQGNEKISIYFKPEGKVFKSKEYSYLDANGQQIMNKLNEVEYSDEGLKALAKQAGKAAAQVLTASLGVNFIIQLLMQGSMSQMFELINTIQILYYMPLIQVYYTDFLRESLTSLGSLANIDIPIPGDDDDDEQSLLNTIFDKKKFKDQPFNEAFEEFGIMGTTFILTYKSKIVLWAVAVAGFPIFHIIMKKYKKKNFFRKILIRVDGIYRYNFAIQAFIELYLEMAILNFIGLYNLQYDNASQIFASIVSLIFFVAVCVIPIFILDIIFENFHRLSSHTFHHRFGTLIENQKLQLNKTLLNMWIPLFFLRRIIYAATIVMLQNNGLMQLIISTFITMWVLAFAIIIRPFKTVRANGLTMLNEGTILFCFLMSFYFVDKDKSDDDRMKYSYVTILAIIGCVTINLIFLFITMGKQIYEGFIKIKREIKLLKELWANRKQKNQTQNISERQLLGESQKLTNTNRLLIRNIANNQNSLENSQQIRKAIRESESNIRVKNSAARQSEAYETNNNRLDLSTSINVNNTGQTGQTLISQNSPGLRNKQRSQLFSQNQRQQQEDYFVQYQKPQDRQNSFTNRNQGQKINQDDQANNGRKLQSPTTRDSRFKSSKKVTFADNASPNQHPSRNHRFSLDNQDPMNVLTDNDDQQDFKIKLVGQAISQNKKQKQTSRNKNRQAKQRLKADKSLSDYNLDSKTPKFNESQNLTSDNSIPLDTMSDIAVVGSNAQKQQLNNQNQSKLLRLIKTQSSNSLYEDNAQKSQQQPQIDSNSGEFTFKNNIDAKISKKQNKNLKSQNKGLKLDIMNNNGNNNFGDFIDSNYIDNGRNSINVDEHTPLKRKLEENNEFDQQFMLNDNDILNKFKQGKPKFQDENVFQFKRNKDKQQPQHHMKNENN
eukprot:403364739